MFSFHFPCDSRDSELFDICCLKESYTLRSCKLKDDIPVLSTRDTGHTGIPADSHPYMCECFSWFPSAGIANSNTHRCEALVDSPANCVRKRRGLASAPYLKRDTIQS